jgi:tRNA(Ile2) C34 agmatinyltransferase TiaS
MKIEKYKPPCCNVGWYVKSRANFRCKKCGKDVTMEVLFLYQAMEDNQTKI